jgi:hypothetical protein
MEEIKEQQAEQEIKISDVPSPKYEIIKPFMYPKKTQTIGELFDRNQNSKSNKPSVALLRTQNKLVRPMSAAYRGVVPQYGFGMQRPKPDDRFSQITPNISLAKQELFANNMNSMSQQNLNQLPTQLNFMYDNNFDSNQIQFESPGQAGVVIGRAVTANPQNQRRKIYTSHKDILVKHDQTTFDEEIDYLTEDHENMKRRERTNEEDKKERGRHEMTSQLEFNENVRIYDIEATQELKQRIGVGMRPQSANPLVITDLRRPKRLRHYENQKRAIPSPINDPYHSKYQQMSVIFYSQFLISF